jgi:sugar-specific transcriptional regulator TrmB
MSIESDLRFLGLSYDEAKIYLACLEYGPLSTSSIARITQIGRTNCYHHTEKLAKKGLLAVSQKGGNKSFSAENPQIIINKQKERLNIANQVLPELLALSSQNPQKPKIRFFEGPEGIQNIFGKMLEVGGKEIMSFSNFRKLSEFFAGSDFLQKHFSERIENKIKTRFISPRDEMSEEFIQNFFPKDYPKKYLEVFLISDTVFAFESEISIFPGFIAISNLSPKNPIGVLIENPELYHTQKAIFDLAWLGATSFITQ